MARSETRSSVVQRWQGGSIPGLLAFVIFCVGVQTARGQRVVLQQGTRYIVLEPYAANIIRITLSTMKDTATAPPGYGVIASPDAADGLERMRVRTIFIGRTAW